MKMRILSGKAVMGAMSLALVALLMPGCGSMQQGYDPVNPSSPYAFPGQPAPVQPTQVASVGQTPVATAPMGGLPVGITTTGVPPVAAVDPGALSASAMRVGDVVTVTFSDIPRDPSLPQKLQIGEDGSVTLPYNVRVQAVGKTPRQLEQEIRGEYVPSIFKFLTVTVQTEQRAFFVGGEVKVPNRYPFVGEITVLRAIQSAGDFTDFANRKKIELIRENGERHQINWFKAIKDSRLDLPVIPNDQIIVHKRGLW